MKLLFTLLIFLAGLPAQSEDKVTSTNTGNASTSGIEFNINNAKARKSLVAFPPLQFVGSPASSPNFQNVGSELFRVIFNDLTVSSLFQFISQSAFLEDTSKTSIRPSPTDPNGFKFESWKQIGAEFLIRGNFSMAGSTLNMEIYAYHVPRGSLVLGKRYRGSKNSARRIAHTFANDLLEALTGNKGPFLSRVVLASDRGGGRNKEIYIMDWDGENVEKITNHRSIAISPTWSPDGQKIAYTAFVQRAKSKKRNADLFMLDLKTSKRWLLSYRQGINSGAAFMPSGTEILLTLSQGGTPDIYRIDTDGKLVNRLTNGPRGAMNVEPAVSPDGKKVAFSSDRSGSPMIYIMNIDGTNPRRITFAGRYNSTPSWSPDSKRLAFSGWENDHFDIFTMNTDGTNMVRITSSKKPNGKWANNEDPVWSPDGRLLMYTSNRTGTNQIYISNLDGSEERRITSDSHNYFKPKWSNNIE